MRGLFAFGEPVDPNFIADLDRFEDELLCQMGPYLMGDARDVALSPFTRRDSLRSGGAITVAGAHSLPESWLAVRGRRPV